MLLAGLRMFRKTSGKLQRWHNGLEWTQFSVRTWKAHKES